MAPVDKHHIVFAGFQVGGSRGARLVAGATDVIWRSLSPAALARLTSRN